MSSQEAQRRRRPIVSVGDLTADLTLSGLSLPVEAARHQLAESISLAPGGSGNFLITGARLGHHMAAVGGLGEDDWGRQVASQLRSEGIDLSGIRQGGSTTLVVVLCGRCGEHVFLGKYGQGNALRFDEQIASLIEGAAAVYCSGYALSEAADEALQILEATRRQGIPVLFDPGPLVTDIDLLRRSVLPLLDTLFVGQDEVPLVTDGAVSAVLQAGPRTVVVKRGAGGCSVYLKNGPNSPLHAPGYPVEVERTSGAGDCFNAAFAVAALRGWSLPDCAKLANAAGAAKVRVPHFPSLEDVRRIIREFGVGINV